LHISRTYPVLADKEPERVIADDMEGAEKIMRHELKLAAEREAARLKKTMSRGFGMGR
jgi:hypothetical protein